MDEEFNLFRHITHPNKNEWGPIAGDDEMNEVLKIVKDKVENYLKTSFEKFTAVEFRCKRLSDGMILEIKV